MEYFEEQGLKTKKIEEPIKKITSFIDGNLSKTELLLFAWDSIEDHSKINFINKEDQQVFWYTISQIQHLGEDSFSEEKFKYEVKECLSYLTKQEKLPKNFSGTPPI